MTAGGSGAIHPLKSINGRKGSDLQKLVEESEESVEADPRSRRSTTSEEIVSIETSHIHACTKFSTSLRLSYVTLYLQFFFLYLYA